MAVTAHISIRYLKQYWVIYYSKKLHSTAEVRPLLQLKWPVKNWTLHPVKLMKDPNFTLCQENCECSDSILSASHTGHGSL